VAAWISYRHAVQIVTAHGEPGAVGRAYPVLIDGLIIAASMVLLDAARHQEAAPRLAWWLLGAGIGATLAVNVLAGVAYGPLGAVVSAWPAAAFVGCYELLMIMVRASARRAAGTAGETPAGGEFPQAVQLPSPPEQFLPGPATSAEEAARAWLRATRDVGNLASANAAAVRFGVPRKTATELRAAVLAESNGHRAADTGEEPS
jgi:hypothetical protein